MGGRRKAEKQNLTYDTPTHIQDNTKEEDSEAYKQTGGEAASTEVSR